MNPEDKLQELILAGAVEVSAVDSETGEFLYSFTEKINEVDPEIARQSENIFHNFVMYLWSEGFLSMDVSMESPIVALTQKAFDKEAIQGLSKEAREILHVIIQAMRIEE